MHIYHHILFKKNKYIISSAGHLYCIFLNLITACIMLRYPFPQGIARRKLFVLHVQYVQV
jgi:hypothetical protein